MSDLVCGACGRSESSGPVYPARCECGGLWSAADPDRYLAELLSDGMHRTPVWSDAKEDRVSWKREDLSRTGSFKDRGARVLVGWAAHVGAAGLVVDSSGSAALAAASAAARAGLPLRVHVPEAIAAEKRAVLSALGADVVAQGSREDAAMRALEEAKSVFYASHVHHPAFSVGTAGAGVEAMEQLGADLPPLWVIPVGNGSLILGLAFALLRANRPDIRLIAVQASACAGLLRPGEGGSSAATGIAIAHPARREEILEAIVRTDGEVLEAGEDEIEAAREALWRRGLAVESASAAAFAGVRQLRGRGERSAILGFLTGSGLRGD